ncbi:MAG TPA: histidine kinase dimerization/phospho-acceptor domain-containing protein, partial [Candidatus Saccharimonadales bacterium]
MLELIVACVSAACNLALSVLVLSKNPQGRLNRDFARFGIALAVWAIFNYVSLHPLLFDQLTWIRIVMAVVSFMMLFILLLANTFPTGERYLKGIERWSIPSAIFVALVALSPWLFTQLNYSADGQPQPMAGFGMVIFVPYVVVVLGLSLTILLRKFLHLRGVAKEYMRYGLIGIISTFGFLLLTNFVVVLAFKNSSLVAFSPLIALLFTASFAYGIIRRKLFDVRLIAARFVAYLLLLIFASILYAFLTAALSFIIVGVYPSVTQIVVSTLIVIALVSLVEPSRRFFNHVTRAVFYQDDYDTKNVLDDLATVLVHSTETKPLVNGSLTILRRALKPDFITLTLVDRVSEKSGKHLSVGVHPPKLPVFTPEQLLHYVTDVVSIDSVEVHPNRFHREMQAAGVSIVVRLQTRSEVVGYCFFGYKTTGSAYSQRDIDVVRIASDELAVAIQNTLRFEQIQDFNTTLRQRVEEATKELRASNEQLHRLDEAKDEFVSMASHQLRTPLTSVKGYISMVLEGDAGKISKMQRQLLDEAFTSSERMVHLIND